MGTENTTSFAGTLPGFLFKAYNFIIFHNKVQDWSCSITIFSGQIDKSMFNLHAFSTCSRQNVSNLLGFRVFSGEFPWKFNTKAQPSGGSVCRKIISWIRPRPR
jgi:hypothetical protein